MRCRTAAAVLVALAALRPAAAAAQFPEDTIPSDTLKADTVDQTARFLKAQQLVAVATPVLPQLGATAVQPARTRIVFNRDSIDWLHGLTLGDLLAQVPGTYIWRGGWYGRTESVAFRARGVNSVEYYLDGVPYLAVGIDSVGVDPALTSLSFLERVEVERLPGQLRVYLFTKRHDRIAPRSRIAITTGDASIARYEGSLERRWPSGLGLSAGADYLSSPTVAASESRYSNNYLWIQGSYLPNAKVGVQYQIVRSTPKRRPYSVNQGIDTLSLGYDATRVDAQLRLSYHATQSGLGPSADLVYDRSHWTSEGFDQTIHQLGGLVSLRTPTFSAGGSAFYRSRWTPFDARAQAGWTPAGVWTMSAEAAFQAHDGSRTSRWTLVRAGVQPVGVLALTASARVGDVVAAPSIRTDAAQSIRDYDAGASLQLRRLGLDVTYSRTSEFTPFAPAEYFQIPTIGTVPATEWLTASVRVAPLQWLTLESWYSSPRQPDGVEGIPPTHSLTRGTIRSKFWRTFPSGSFDLKLQVGLESWGTGTIGRDATDAPIELRGATFLRTLVQFQIGTFSFFWDRGNLTATNRTYVPGFRLPSYATTFGVRWGFLN